MYFPLLFPIPSTLSLTLSVIGDEYLSLSPWFDSYPFEIPLKQACNNIIIDTGTLIGDYDIYLTGLTPKVSDDFDAVKVGAFSFGQDSLALCTNPSNTTLYGGSNGLNAWLKNIPAGDTVARITGLLIGYGHFNLTVSGALLFIIIVVAFFKVPYLLLPLQ